MKNKKMIFTATVLGTFIILAGMVGLIVQHQKQVNIEVNNSLTQYMVLDDSYQKELAAAEAVVEQSALYANHQNEGNFANEVSVPLNVHFDTTEMAFVSDLNHVLETKDVHSFVNLFKQEELRAWLNEQNVKAEPEQFIYSYMQECMNDIQAFYYYQRAGEPYLRIVFKGGQVKNTQLAVIPEQDLLRFSLSLDEFKEYISVS